MVNPEGTPICDHWCTVESYTEVGRTLDMTCADDSELVACVAREFHPICLSVETLSGEASAKSPKAVYCH